MWSGSLQVVITNVSAATRRLAVLLQIPEGAVPVSNGFTLKTSQITLGAYTTGEGDVTAVREAVLLEKEG